MVCSSYLDHENGYMTSLKIQRGSISNLDTSLNEELRSSALCVVTLETGQGNVHHSFVKDVQALPASVQMAVLKKTYSLNFTVYISYQELSRR